LKNVKVDFEVALRVGGINECKLKKLLLGPIFEKISNLVAADVSIQVIPVLLLEVRTW